MQQLETSINLFIADHQEIFRDGLKLFIHSIPHLAIVGESNEDESLLHQIQQSKPSIVFLDASLPLLQLPVVVQAIREMDAHSKILVFYCQQSEQHLLNILSAKVDSILHKSISKQVLETAINTVLSGQTFYCALTNNRMQQLIGSNRYHHSTKATLPIFTEKEKSILQLITLALTSKQIASKLGMSVRTIEAYRKSLQEKTGSKNSAGLILYAIKNGLVPIERI